MRAFVRSKKGFELSVNFIVSLIIAIVLFGFGIAFATQMFAGGEEISEQVYKRFDSQVQELACPGSDPVCVAVRSTNVERGKLRIVPLAIKNLEGEARSFLITMNVEKYQPVGEEVIDDAPPEGKGISVFDLEDGRVESLDNREKETFGLGISAPKGAIKGKYWVSVGVRVGNTETTTDPDDLKDDLTSKNYIAPGTDKTLAVIVNVK